MTIAGKVILESRFAGVRCVFWATVFAWAASSIIAVSFEMLAAVRATVFSTLLLSLYGLSKLEPQRHRVPLRMTWAATALLAIWYILYCLFGDVDVDAILFHLNYDVGSADVQRETLKSALFAAIPFVWLVISWNSLARMSRGLATVNRLLPIGLLAVNPLIWIGVQETLASSPVSAVNLQSEYVVPAVDAPKHGKAKNLIHIFVESAELTLWDDERFGNVAQPLKRLSEGAWTASNIAQVELTGWTLAGQVASTCGIPLFSLGVINKNSFDLVEEILPEARCLGDFLQDRGYFNVFLKGASLDFAGTRSFATAHGYEHLLGYHELKHRFPDRFNYWGLHDEDTLQIAYEQVSQLGKEGRPYSLTLTTVGGHAPTGHVSPLCQAIPFVSNQPNDTLRGMACTNLLLERFIERLRREHLLENTVVVIQSDHLAMRNEVYGQLQASERRNMFIVLGDGRLPDNAKPASAVDIFPTILTALGFAITDGRAGLGRALQNEGDTLVQRLGIEGFNRAIDEADGLRDQLWSIVRNAS